MTGNDLRTTRSTERPPFRAAGAEPLREASFALRRRESDLRLTEGAGRPRISARAPAAASAASPGAPRASESRTPKRTATGAKASPASRAAASRSSNPSPAEDRAPGTPAAVSIGVISDNHGYLDPAVLEHFAGVVHIIHAGDIVDPEILAALETVAPVTAVAGNMDSGGPLAGPAPRSGGRGRRGALRSRSQTQASAEAPRRGQGRGQPARARLPTSWSTATITSLRPHGSKARCS